MQTAKILPIKASDFQQAPAMKVLGSFEGECADATITNNNGLDITRPVWENVIASDEYKQAVNLGWYIGFLGHPEDPNCMDFRNACIVMRSMRIDDSGKIYGKFDLVDTPVGRVVKSFIDAGVTFGISVRGAGDIVSNSVDPETFVFRGFDLVTFPAYPDAIPVFTEIAASSDVETQKKYKKVQATIKANVQSITSATALDVIQSQLAAQSDEYATVEAQKASLCGTDDVEDKRVQAMTDLYLDQVTATKVANQLLEDVRRKSNQKLKRVSSIMSSQMARLRSKNRQLQQENDKLVDSSKLLNRKYQTSVAANSKLKDEIESINLKYEQEVISSQHHLNKTNSILSSARVQQGETVAKLKAEQKKTSNLDAEVSRLKKKIEATSALLSEFQRAYAELYATALGKEAKLTITATTSVSDLRSAINGNSLLDDIDEAIEYDVVSNDEDEESIVTL